LFGEFGANPSLEPETNRTLEAGLELAGKRQLRASILYFNRKEENFVFFDNSSFQYLNADNVIDAEGVEIELNWKPCSKFQWSANYTFTERKGDSGIRIPKHKINTLLGYTFSERSFASINYAYNGARTDTDFNTFTDVSLEPYSLLGCFVSHSLIPGKLKVFLNVDNLLNTAYTEVIGFNTRGRNMRLGINLRL
jgi:vitamin B12 transporter